MDRLDMHTDDLAAGNVDRLGELFPSVITETIDDDGNTVRGVDFDLLRQELAGRVVDGPRERYQLDWPGKRAAAFAANAPIAKTLRPDREESVDFDTTKNLFIEGDNLDALKLLQESYLGKVKLIYIDPPYNTGKDFVYSDRFAETTGEYLAKSGQVDTEGNRLVANTESNGRFHSDWLSMMYPRLKLARNLLTDDGIIAISIDENEMSNLTRICCEVFGSDNHLFSLSVITNPKGRSQDKYVARSHEYLIGFSRSALGAGALDIPREESDVAQRFPLEDGDGRYREHELRNTHREFGQHNRPNLYFPLYVDPESKSVSVRPSHGTVGVLPTWNDGFEGCWTWSKGKAASSTSLLVAKEVRGDWKVFRKVYAAEDGEVATRKVKSVWKDRTFHTEKGQEAFDNLFPGESKLFQAPKPIALLERIIQMGSGRDSVILDFFAGSSSLAHAVLQLNCSDGGSRRFIEVQLGEAVGNSSRAGGLEWATVAEISKERIQTS